MCAEPVTSPDSPDLELVVMEHHTHDKAGTLPGASFDKLSADLADPELHCLTCEDREKEREKSTSLSTGKENKSASNNNQYLQIK